jgi:hypothetical protein|tara:strand:+ start:713 stop:991 length:279 start_codon:yes stop_codon:yes gene_type:complete
MKLKKIDVKYFKPVTKQINPDSIPLEVNGNIVRWNNMDSLFEVELNLKTKEITGLYYDFDESKQDWIDTKIMSDLELEKRIKNYEFLLVTIA